MLNSIKISKEQGFYALSLFFIVTNIVAVINEFYLLILVPAVVLTAVITIYRMDWIYLAIVFFTPLSIGLEELEFGLGIHLPTEPLMFGLLVIFIFKYLYDGNYSKKVLFHPVSMAILFYLAWMLITVSTSEIPLISLKHFISKLWFIFPFYFFAVVMFKNENNIDRFVWFFCIPMSIVVVWSSYNLAIRGFDEKPAHWVMQPFFKDHTSYGAVIAFFIPILLSFGFMKGMRVQSKILVWIILVIFILGVIFSYTRAAWVSLAIALGCYVLIRLKIKLPVIIASAAVVFFLFFSFKTEIFQKLEKNKQDSSSDLTEHVESISNVASDASNLERINRWTCAIEMFKERPVFGYGPGTYAFLYAPYQKSYNLTIISTNFGDLGNAHSEYLGALAETGVLGSLAFILIGVIIMIRGIRLYQIIDYPRYKAILIGAILGLITYYAHAVLNNYLDMDKMAVPFWSFMAIIVAIDIFHRNKLISRNRMLKEVEIKNF